MNIAMPRSRLLASCMVSIAVFIFLFVYNTVDAKFSALFLIGIMLGAVLLIGEVSFAGGWRKMIVTKDGRSLKAQLIMIGFGSLLFFPLLNHGYAFGHALRGATAPIGVSLWVGASIFGIGMQLGGGCGSGTLYSAGGGNMRMFIVLAFFVVGGLIGSLHLGFWFSLPAFQPVVLYELLGLFPAYFVQLLIITCVYGAIVFFERFSKVGNVKKRATALFPSRGLIVSVCLLVILNIVILLVAGFPWGITSGLTLWGGKLARAIGFNLGSFAYWQWPNNAYALRMPVFADVTSMLNIGILVGASGAAALTLKFNRPAKRIPGKHMASAVIGGLMLGYGARLAYGCNIGAFFSGAVSGSLHGWVWFASAFFGSIIGVRLRRVFDMGE